MGDSMQTEILEAAKEYLIENFGNQASPGRIYFNENGNTWNVEILVKTPKGIIPVGEAVFNLKGDMIEVPTKEALLSVLKTRLNERKERILPKVHSKDLMRVKRVVRDVPVI